MRYGLTGLPVRPLIAVFAWSIPESLPTAIAGFAVAKAVDSGFLADRPLIGLAWLSTVLLAAGAGAVGSRFVFANLGGVVEPFRDRLVRRVVRGALGAATAGRPGDGAVTRLTRQVEIVRDAYAGLILSVKTLIVTVIGVTIGLLSLSPLIAALILPPFALGLLAFIASLGLAAERHRRALAADERLSERAGAVLTGARDLAAHGAEAYGESLVAGPIAEQARAERSLAWVAALRALCFTVGGWLPLVVVLAAGPLLVDRGLTAGAIMGGLTYVLMGLQPALNGFITAVGGSGLRYVITLDRILAATDAPPGRPAAAPPPAPGHSTDGAPGLVLDKVTFAYGPHSAPVVADLDVTVPAGDHLAVVGLSGIGKSTLAGLMCGLLAPDAGSVRIGGVGIAGSSPAALSRLRVLIPQEAYVFTGTLAENLRYLRPDADPELIADTAWTLGAADLLRRIGGLSATVLPARLSASERQLIALVRAHLSEAPIVVLDEATCHLDPVAERRVELAFANRPGTLVVIAHRVSSALRARRVLVMDGGSATVGDHDTLPAVSPLYAELLGHWRGDPSRPGEEARPRSRGRFPEVTTGPHLRP